VGALVEGLREGWVQATLSQRVAVLVGLWVLVSAVVGGSIASWYVQRITVSREAEVVSEFVRGQVDGTRLEAMLGKPDSSRTLADLGDLMHGLQSVQAIRRIKMYDRQGTIVWSDDSRIIGIRSPSRMFDAALEGTVTHNLEIPQGPEHVLDTVIARNREVVEILVPILGRIPNRPVAVVEVYREAAPLLTRLWQVRLVVWGGVVLSGCLAFGSVLLIVRRVSASLERDQRRLEGDFCALLDALGMLADLKDPYAKGHTRRVQAMAVALAAEMGIPAGELATIRTAAGIHDIGKIGVPESAFAKAGPLMPVDWERIKTHPEIGAGVISPVERLQVARTIIRHHHERFDGFGYPARLAGKNIPLGARILAVADAFVAMTSPRPHRVLIPAPDALGEIRREAGRQFDPAVVSTLERLAVRHGPAGLMALSAGNGLLAAST
jgi:HD-GYP domain-containing protein (c-di-GMP phosphodiesterase class II)